LAFWFALLITSAKNAQVRQYKSCLNKVNCSESSEQFHKYRERLGHYLSTLSKLLRGAVKAVINYVQSGYRSFSYRQDCDVRRYMNGQPNKDGAADTVLNASRPFLKSDESERVKGQLSYIVQDMKEEHQQNRNRNIHM